MTKPCPHCPFRSDLPHGYLTAGRITEICESLGSGASFPCHKTTEAWEDEDGFDEMHATEKSQQCAGASIFLAKQGASTQLERVAGRLGRRVSTLDMESPVVSSHQEMLKAHRHEVREDDCCSIVGHGCLAPAGFMHGAIVIEALDNEPTFECEECGQPVCSACSENGICDDCRDTEDEE